MSSRHERNQSNSTLTQKVGPRISDRMWEMRQAIGKDSQGNMQSVPCYVDMRSGGVDGEKMIHYGEEGWSSTPNNLPSGDEGREPCWQPPTEAYKRGYELIQWDK